MTRHGALRYWLPPALWAGIILVGTSLPRVPGPDVVGFDKVSHLIAYGALGALLLRAFRSCRPRGSATAWTLAAGGLYGALDELHQSWIPGRSTDVLDFAADFTGLVIAVAAVWTWERLRDYRATTESVDHAQTVINEERTDNGRSAASGSGEL